MKMAMVGGILLFMLGITYALSKFFAPRKKKCCGCGACANNEQATPRIKEMKIVQKKDNTMTPPPHQ